MKTNEEKLEILLSHLTQISYVKPDSIPDIDLYMDQVTTFMNEQLSNTKRYSEDKVLTKTMINNYAKNNLLPPPLKKKYSKDHIFLLIFIYYFKNLLSFNDIEEIFRPITQKHFSDSSDISLLDIYKEVFSLAAEQKERLEDDIKLKFERASKTFDKIETNDREYLQLFSFICELSFDVYLKKQMIENLTDQLRNESNAETDKKKK